MNHEKPTSPYNKGAPLHQEKPELFLWLVGVTFHKVGSVYKFNIMNIWHELAANSMQKLLVWVTHMSYLTNDLQKTLKFLLDS